MTNKPFGAAPWPVPRVVRGAAVIGALVAGHASGYSDDQLFRSATNPFQNRYFHFEDPAYYQAGNFFLTPTLYIEGGFDDNLLNSSDEPLEIPGEPDGLAGENDAVIEPIETGYINTDAYIEAALKDRNNSYALSYRFLGGTYFDSSEDDYADHKFNADIYVEANSKNAFNVYGEYFMTHEARGTGFSDGPVAQLEDEPFKYNDALLGLLYTLGNMDSIGRLELEGSWFQREWDSQERVITDQATDESEELDVTASRNREEARARGAFFVQVAPKTDLLFEARYGDISYEVPPPGGPGQDNRPSQDSKELYGLFGATWTATAKTNGTVKLGYFSKDFTAEEREDFTSLTWDVRFLWEPATYSRLYVTVRRFPLETEGTGSFIDSQQYGVGWKQHWLERFSTGLDVNFFNNNYEDSEPEREDDLLFVTLRADYDIVRWLSLGAGYRYQERESTVGGLNYDRNRIFVSLALSL